MNVERLLLDKIRPLYIDHNPDAWHDTAHVQYFGQVANNYVRERISSDSGGLMIAKFGTVELNNLCAYRASGKKMKSLTDYWWYLRGYQSIFPNDTFLGLCNNAGFFPCDIRLGYKWKNLVLDDMKNIDILGSYIYQERRFKKELKNAVKIDIDGYIAPFKWDNPWTAALKNKRVLVVHPFTDTIAIQYEKRKFLFQNENVLPEFTDLYLIKAVQSIAGNGEKTGFADWFEALDYMKTEMSKYNYDVALIGCGAYGMHLAAHAKREGKVGIHTAGWTQMLFGIYGNRWLVDQPEYSKYINEHWVRPSVNETPHGAANIENACYW